jgi:hypothetical protein
MSSSKHHRKARSRGGLDTPRNIVRVNDRKHHAFHVLFQNNNMESVVRDLNDTWLDPDCTVFLVWHRGRSLSPQKIKEVQRELNRIVSSQTWSNDT